MQEDRELTINGKPEQLKSFLVEIGGKLKNGWRLGKESEDGVCFVCDARRQRQAARLCLYYKEPSRLWVSNIVPIEWKDLSIEECNHILEDFYSTFVVGASADVVIHLGDAQVRITNWISEECNKKLELFSDNANKSTGSGHPADKGRWNDFIICCHNERADIPDDKLQEWLMTPLGWDEDRACKLVSEYRHGRDLLNQYDNRP